MHTTRSLARPPRSRRGKSTGLGLDVPSAMSTAEIAAKPRAGAKKPPKEQLPSDRKRKGPVPGKRFEVSINPCYALAKVSPASPSRSGLRRYPRHEQVFASHPTPGSLDAGYIHAYLQVPVTNDGTRGLFEQDTSAMSGEGRVRPQGRTKASRRSDFSACSLTESGDEGANSQGLNFGWKLSKGVRQRPSVISYSDIIGQCHHHDASN